MRKNLSHISGQLTEKLVFDGRQVQLLFAHISCRRGKIDFQISVYKNRAYLSLLGLHIADPAEGGTKPCQQLLDAEGLREIIVGPRIQGLYFVLILGPRTDHDNGDGGPASYLSYDIQAVHIRQSQIQKDDLRAVGGYRQHGLRPVGSFFIMVSLCLQGGRNQVGDCLFILHNQKIMFRFHFYPHFCAALRISVMLFRLFQGNCPRPHPPPSGQTENRSLSARCPSPQAFLRGPPR